MPEGQTLSDGAARVAALADARSLIARDADRLVDATEVVFVVDDDFFARDSISDALAAAGRRVVTFESCEAFLAAYSPQEAACLVLDMHFAGLGGLDLLRRLDAGGLGLPTVAVSGSSNIPIVVDAMKMGAVDFLEKPLGREPLRASVEGALRVARDAALRARIRKAATDQISALTPRQRQIMQLILEGQPSKNIAADLGISQRTVESHRASIMQKTGAGSMPGLALIAVAAFPGESDRASQRARLAEASVVPEPVDARASR